MTPALTSKYIEAEASLAMPSQGSTSKGGGYISMVILFLTNWLNFVDRYTLLGKLIANVVSSSPALINSCMLIGTCK